MFANLKSEAKNEEKVSRGNFFALFTDKARFLRYLSCILLGTPIWYVLGILITFSPKLAKDLWFTGPIPAGDSVFSSYLGFSFRAIGSGAPRQYFAGRRGWGGRGAEAGQGARGRGSAGDLHGGASGHGHGGRRSR